MDIARETALGALMAVETDSAFANIALDRVLEKHSPSKLDRAFATELFYGVIRRLNTLDWVLAKFLKHPLESQTPYVKNILRLGLYQMMYLDRVPVSAACNESAKLAHKFGHTGSVKFVNGVLRNVARNMGKIEYPSLEKYPVSHIALKYSHPAWIVQRCIDWLGVQETIEFCRSNNTPPPNTVRTNTLQLSREELAQKLREEGIQARETEYAPEALNINNFTSLAAIVPFQEGLFYVQDESSMLAAHALSPQEGSYAMDVCGGPGGKTTHLAQLMNNTGTVISADIHEHKLRLIRQNCERLGVKNVELIQADARRLPDRFKTAADYVLVDAPCSGLGVIRRKPDIKWRAQEKQLPILGELQQEILTAAALCVRPGGVLVYSTCTITREENEEVVEKFLREHSNYTPDGLHQYGIFRHIQGDSPAGAGLRLWPHLHNTDGFFIARMRKDMDSANG